MDYTAARAGSAITITTRFAGPDFGIPTRGVAGAQRAYSSVSEYVRDLIRNAQKRKTKERIDALLLEGLDSGSPIPVTAEYWEEKKRKLAERLSLDRKTPGR